jgi:hypothetical protein
MEGINYFCEMESEKRRFTSPITGGDDSEKNTVLVIQKLEKNSVLIRLGESHTDFHRPKRTEAGMIII